MHVPDLETALGELGRVLRPGGRLAIMENNARSLHVRGWDRLVRVGKRVLGRRLHELHDTERGLEEWRDEGLMVRRTDMRWLVDFYRERGLRLRRRFAGQFTELYTNLPGPTLRRAVYRFNEAYAKLGGPAGLALGNVLVFEKERA
jgi:ubiquinone/menaquinone biosynthesis C-methylase UbiE